ncbi:MAG: ribosome maturation factor RimP [Myxococcota bacterium]|jgi:ribosome maturation factor RimP|nr:ribosome maturation factor RimP [Myxococcota bacterium]
MPNEQIAETLDRLHQIVEGVVVREGYELVDLDLGGGKKRKRLLVMIDRPGRTSYARPARGGDGEGPAAVGIADCVKITRALGPVLDVEDVIRSAYNLEVSSPGLDRPLKRPEHFRLAVGMTVRLKTRVPIDGESFFVAELLRADEDGVEISVRGEERCIPYRHIRQARLEVQF